MDEIFCLTLGDFAVNTYFFAYEDKLCCVDPGDEGEKIVHTIEELQKKYSLAFESIFLTHAHLDHVGALLYLKSKFPTAKIYADINEKEHLGKGSYRFQYNDFAASGMQSFVEKILASNEDLPNADVFFHNDDVLFGGWKVLETPGHTSGSCCLYNEAKKILFSGDTLFFYGYGRTDLCGGSDSDMAKSLIFLSSLPKDTIVYPGHDKYGFVLGKAQALFGY